MWADCTKEAERTFAKSDWTQSISSYTSTWSDLNCDFYRVSNNSKNFAYARMAVKGGSSTSSTTTATGYIRYKTAINSAVSKVMVIHAGTTDAIGTNLAINWVAISVYNGSTKVDSVTITSSSLSFSKDVVDTIVFTPTSGDTWSSGYKYNFYANIYCKGKSNRGLNITKLEFDNCSAGCSNTVALSKGSESHGAVTTIGSASVATCSGTASDRRVTITVTPDECYDAPSTLTWTKSSGTVTATKRSGPTDNGNGTFSYVYEFNQNDNGAGTFGVTCTAKDPGKTVNFDAGPGSCLISSLTETCDGSGVTLPAVTASGVCKGWTTFAGWATSAVSDSTTTSGVTLYAAGSKYVPASDNMTLYAIYSKVKGGGSTTLFSEDFAALTDGGDETTSDPSSSATSTSTLTQFYSMSNAYPAGGTVKLGGKSSVGYLITNAVTAAIGDNLTISFKVKGWSSVEGDIQVSGNNSEFTTPSNITYTATINDDYQNKSVTVTLTKANPKIKIATTEKRAFLDDLVITKGSSATYYCSDPNCCTELGSINGSVSWSNDGTSLTVKNWGYTPANTGDESHISKYTVYLYSDADSYAASIDNEDCTVANRASTGVTFTGLNYARTYKVKIIATPASGYCPVDDVWSSTTYKLTCATPTAATAGSFARATQKMPISWTSGAGKVDICYSSNSSTPAATPGSGYTVVSDQTSSPVNLDVSGLAAGNYYCWVRSVCDASNKSSWTAITGSTFTIPAHTLTITKDGGGSSTITPASGSSVVEGRTASITATPATGYAFDHWAVSGTNATLSSTSTNPTTFTMGTANATVTGYFTCVPPVIGTDPADANYYTGDSPEALEVEATLASGTLTYLWKVSTDNGDNWSNADGTNNLATYSGASLSTASAGTIKFKCVVGNSEGGCSVESGVATITVSNASYFPNGKTIFIQAHSTSAWTGDGCVMAWFHTAGGSETAQSTYWLFDATGGDAGKKLFATVVPASGDLPYLDIQRFASNCSDWWNKNGGCSYADASGSNAIRSTGKHDDSSDGDYIRWNGSGVTMNLMSSDAWLTPVASMTDQGSGIWSGTYEYTPSNTSTEYVIATNYNGNIGNTGSNSNATLSGMVVGSTYNVTATLDIKDHSLEMSKTFVKGTVHFNLQGHGSAISDLTNVTAGSTISAPSAPSADGWTFGGWYKEPACTNAWTFATDEVEETMTLYAKWTANVYTITKTFSNVANASIPDNFTYTGSTTTALNSTFTVNTTNFFLPSSIAVTMGGSTLTAGTDYTYNSSTGAFTFDVTITGNIVITATATAKLKSIAITTQPTTRKYFAGESFSSTGTVVTATMGDGSTKAVTASATWAPAGALSAGTSQTVTATYTEAGIEKTATTTIDVYSVTVNKVNEDGDAVSADGVTATWTVGTKALAASASGASKYVFKQWDVTGATAASTSSANTTLSNPTANVVVNAVFYKPRVVKWSVNGNDSYNTGGPTTTVAYNGTISTVPTNPSGLACAGTFVAWTDAAHNNGQTAKDDDSYYESKLFTDAGDFPNITAETTTFYAVFAERTNSDGYKYIGDDGTLADGKKYIFVNAKSAGSAYALKATDLAAPNSGNNGTAVSVTVTSNAEGVLVTTVNTDLEFEYVSSGTKLKYEVDGPATRYLFINGDGVGMKSDDSRSRYTTDAGLQGWNNKVNTYYDVYYNSTNEKFERKESAGSRVYAFIKQTATYGNYVTECDANIVSVTYNANSGSTSCTNTTTDKTEDYTVCSTPPTRDYYIFAGWLCSADSKTYAANATISAAAIDADFTLTAQWTPVPYSITYNYNGGSAQVDPTPATSYTVESSEITLQTPTKGHDRFDGWYENADLSTGGVKTTIAAGSHENKTYYAKWTARHEIVFDYTGSASSGTTTIYRAEDENMEDVVAGQGSVPSDPSAPTDCSSKVFVGWSESTIEDETNDKPADLMKPAAGKVTADKHYYAVWATATPASIPATYAGTGVFQQITSMSQLETGTYYVLRGVNGSTKKAMGNTVSSGKMGAVADPVSDGKITNPGVAIVWKLGGTKDAYTLYNQNASKYVEITSNSTGGYELKTDASTSYTVTVEDGHGFFFKSNHASANLRGISIYNVSEFRSYILSDAKTLELYKMPKTIYTAYSTSCCATKIVLSDPSITDASSSGSTITFDKSSPVYTCGGTKTVTATLTLTAGYQASALSFAVNSGTVSISPAISTPITSSQVYTLTFAEDQNATLTTTATIAAKPLNGITITPSSGEVYVGQYVDFTVSYDPADYISTGYTLDATPVYVTKESAAPANTKLRLKGGRGSGPGASITETVNETVTIKASGDNTKTASVNMTVNPLPRVHFEDLVHGKEFADVVATIAENALNPNKTTKTSVDWTTPNANTCEENHLHLVGWIREDWPALVTYLNGGAQPTTTAIVGAGNDGSGHAYFIAAGASINVQTFDGVTFYAVWAEIK